MIRVLFVCLGNICRSPMAEAVFRHKVKAAGLEEKIDIDSAGTGDWHVGEPPHHGTRALLDRHGISYVGMKARHLDRADLDGFDYVLTMDDQNLADTRALRRSENHRARIVPLLEFAPGLGVSEVPDPWYTGGFDGVHAMIDVACDNLLAHIRREHGL